MWRKICKGYVTAREATVMGILMHSKTKSDMQRRCRAERNDAQKPPLETWNDVHNWVKVFVQNAVNLMPIS